MGKENNGNSITEAVSEFMKAWKKKPPLTKMMEHNKKTQMKTIQVAAAYLRSSENDVVK